jgi:3-deoxy-manno-octulosonate cytidylyltransferase (CMP-KDO synthetase)
VIPFRRQALFDFAQLPPTPLERYESIDMLRWLEHGRRIRLVEADRDTHAVDTPDDLKLVAHLMRADPLVGLYSGGRSTHG